MFEENIEVIKKIPTINSSIIIKAHIEITFKCLTFSLQNGLFFPKVWNICINRYTIINAGIPDEYSIASVG